MNIKINWRRVMKVKSLISEHLQEEDNKGEVK